jgi:uncharacterized protein YggE
MKVLNPDCIIETKNSNMMKKQALIFIFLLMGSFGIYAQDLSTTNSHDDRIVVTGTAEMEVEPDEIYMTFTLREYDNKSKEKVDLETIRKEFLKACSDAGIASTDIAVQQVGGNAYNRWWYLKNSKRQDFRATVSYEIRFTGTPKIDALMPMLNDDALSNAWISKNDHSRMEEFKKDVRINALKAAREKANAMAESIGQKAGRAIRIEEQGTGAIPYVNYRMQTNVMMDEGGSSKAESTPFKKLLITQQVLVEFELE